MATIRLRGDVELSDFGRPYIVAEVNTSHFGDLVTAKAMIDAAQSIGCDCVKFQSWSASSLYSADFYRENPIAKRFTKKFSFGEPELLELSKHCRAVGVAFASTPYAREEVAFLVERCGVPYVKVASMDLVNLPYLDAIGRMGAPIVLSTGMGEMAEIERAVETVAKTGNEALCVLHCVSTYPAEPEALRLKNILGLREAFPDVPIGYSDHSLGTEMPAAAVALGACMIEKHFTLDSSRIGMDNQMATEPDEMARLVEQCHRVHEALGGPERVVTEAEVEQRSRMRRSVVATRDLPAGTCLTIEDLDAKRPGTGLPPERLADLVGRTLARDVADDTLITDEDLLP